MDNPSRLNEKFLSDLYMMGKVPVDTYLGTNHVPSMQCREFSNRVRKPHERSITASASIVSTLLSCKNKLDGSG